MRLLLITILASVPALSAVADIDARLTMENDTFLCRHDDDYTHGTRLDIHDSHTGDRFQLAQTMYAPSDLRRKDHIKGDRPYCGMLIAGLGRELSRGNDSPFSHYAELDFGMIGPSAGGKTTQKTIHRWLGCKDPQGWDNQLHDEFVVNAQYWMKYNWDICDYVSIVPRLGLAAGTIQDFAEVGVDLKIGYNIRRDPTPQILFSAVKEPSSSFLDDFSCYAFVGVGERYYLYNHVLEGSLFNHKDDDLDVDIEPFVSELRFGIALTYKRFFFSYYAVLRTDEFKNQPNAPNYGGISVGWTF